MQLEIKLGRRPSQSEVRRPSHDASASVTRIYSCSDSLRTNESHESLSMPANIIMHKFSATRTFVTCDVKSADLHHARAVACSSCSLVWSTQWQEPDERCTIVSSFATLLCGCPSVREVVALAQRGVDGISLRRQASNADDLSRVVQWPSPSSSLTRAFCLPLLSAIPSLVMPSRVVHRGSCIPTPPLYGLRFTLYCPEDLY